MNFKILATSILLFFLHFSSAQTAPGGIGNSDGSDGQPEMKLWLLPDSLGLSNGNDVTSWADYSGNSNNLTQGNTLYTPIFRSNAVNGHDYLEFSKSLNRIVRNPIDMPADAVSVFYILRTSNATGDAILSYNTASQDNAYLIYQSSAMSTYINANVHNSGLNYADGNWKIYAHQWRNSDGRLLTHLNGTESLNTTHQAGVIIGAGGSLAIGGEQDTPDGGYDAGQDYEGDIAEMIMFGSSLKQAQRVVVENYLAQKYAMDANLPVDRFVPLDVNYIVSMTGMGKESDGTIESECNGLVISQNGNFDNGEYIFSAHDGTSNTEADINRTSEVTNSGAVAAWNRSWYIDKSGSVDAKIAFDFSDGIAGQNPAEIANYVLLYRSDLVSDYQYAIIDSKGIQNGDQVFFAVSDANLADGYYTLGTTDESNSPLVGVAGKNWYTLISGNWEDWEVWTLDPSGSLPNNPGNEIPSGADNVYILTGKTVTINTNTLSNPILSVEGRIDFQTFTGHSFGEIKGNGRILLAADEFPGGDASHFYTAGQGEGTVEYYGNSFSLSQSLEFYNLIINMNAGQTLTLLQDYTVNNYFRVEQGTFQINDNSTTTDLIINVTGDINVLANGSITTGSGNARHQINSYGDFINLGSVAFTNRVAAIYTSEATDGIVDYNALNNTANQRIQCKNTSIFYRIEIDKGIDHTYELSIEADNASYFNLYGYANQGHASLAQLTDNDNALGLVKGTVRLKTNVNVPVLNNTGNYNISEAARLWVDGGSAAKSSGIAIVPYGEAKITSGTFDALVNSGFTLRDNGIVRVEGGTLTANQFRTSVLGVGNIGGFYQSGGTANFLGGDTNTDYYVFNLTYGDNVFIMTGGTLHIHESHGKGGIFINSDVGNYNVSGGTVICEISDTEDFIITSKAPFWDMILRNSLANSNEIILDEGIDVGSTDEDLAAQPLNVLNDLTIETDAILNANSFDVKIGDDFDFENGAAYTHGGNTTWFHERGHTARIYVRDNASTNPLVFNNVTIEKDQRSDPSLFRRVQVRGGSRTSTNSAVLIEGNLLINRGEFDTEDYEVNLEGNIDIVDGQILSTGSSLGRIVLINGSAQHNLAGAFGKEQDFGHIDLDDALGVILLSDVNCTDVTLTTGMFDLDTYNLTASGNLNNYNSSRYFRTAGNASDGGLTLEMILSGTYAADELVAEFPVGVVGYTPGEVYIDDYTLPSDLTGSIQVNPVNTFHPATRNSGNVLHYYWMSEETGFSSIPNDNAYYRFIYTSNIPNNNREHVLFDNVWVDANSGINNSPILEFKEATFGIIDGEFTAGRNGEFNNRRLLYSRQSGTWHDLDTWSEDPHGGTQDPLTGNLPESSDICIVGEGDRINVTTGSAAIDIAKLQFDHDTIVSHGIEDLPRVQVDVNNTGNFYKVTGTGIFTQWIDNTNDPVITGDFGDFSNEKYSWFLYVADVATVNLPTSPRVYPGVMIEGNGNRATFTEDIIINRHLNPRGNSIVSMNTGANGDISLKGDLWLGDWNHGKLEFGSTGTERTITIEGDIDFTQDAGGITTPTNYREILVDNSTPSSLEHQIILYGSIIQGVGIIDLFNSGATSNNAILRLVGVSNATFERTGSEVTDLYRIIMNKNEGDNFNFNDSFTLGGPTDGDPKALELISGDLTLNDNNIDITLNSGGADFKIPQESSFSVSRGIVRVSGSNTGIWLDGEMTVGFGSEWFINEGTNNYIEYTSSGNSQIDINNGELFVGSQIRRSLSADEGILNFHQDNSGSTVIIGTDVTIPANGRATFDLANTGSQFGQVANSVLIIANAPTGNADPAVYINLDLIDNPAAANLETGSVIQLGGDDTQSGQEFGIFSNIDLVNITLSNSSTNDPTAKIWTLPITLSENLTIATNTDFDANGLQINIGGDMTINGTFTPNDNTVIFDGSADQNITGVTSFYNMTKDPNPNTLILNNDITVNNELKLNTGTLNDGDNTLHAKGYVWMDALHIWGGTSDGISFDGIETQVLQSENGTIAFAKLSVNNPGGADSIAVFVPEGNNITIDDMLQMERGIIDIGKNLIEIDDDASINEKNAFSEFNMIQTNISFTDAGIKKYFPAIAVPTTFIYPIGSAGKYTPVEFTIDAVDAGGSIRVKAADEIHPTIINDDEPCDNIIDSLNVLKYHWLLDADGINNLSATTSMTFDPADIQIDNSLSGTTYDITSYIAARLLLTSSSWNKYDPNSFDEDADRLIFTFSGTNDDGVSGDYTAGIEDQDGTCEGAIPDMVQSYVTINNGDWTNETIWDTYPTSGGTVPAGGPRGAIVYIEHDVVIPQDYIISYKTTIDTGDVNNGILRVNNTFGHRLGIVDGIGTLHTYRGTIPAGIYDDFFSTSGGTLDFAGTDDYDLLSEIVSINNVIFSGSGERRLPNLDLQILGNMYLNGPDLINEHNEKLKVMGDITFDAGTYNTGFGTEAVIVLNGSSPQVVGGTQSFTSTTNDFNNLEIENSAGVTLNNPLDLFDHLSFNNGIIYTDNINILTLASAEENIVTGAGNGKFVDGPLNKNIQITTAVNFDFPVGNDSRYGNIILSGISADGIYQAEYFNYNPINDSYDPTLFDAPLQVVSDNEYWRVYSSVPATTGITLRWDAQSGMYSGDVNEIEIAEWRDVDGNDPITTDDLWQQVDAGNNAVGDATSGTITQTNTNTFNEFGIGNIFTISSIYIPQILTWDGSVSTVWNEPDNWTPANVPTQLDDINIPDEANDPAISIAANCNAVNSLVSGASLTINPGASLTIHGDFTNNGDVYILSPTDSGAGGSLIDNGVINGTGNFHVERYLTSNEYHYVSSPISGGGNANSDLFTAHQSGWFNPNFYEYNETYDLDGDPGTSPSGIFDSNSLVPGWVEAHNGDGGAAVNMNIGQGYSFWDNLNKNVTYIGTVNTGIQDITGLTYTNNDPTSNPLPDVYDGWNLIGNPYPSAVDWDLIDDGIVNMDNAIYVWDGTQYASYVSGISGGSGNQNNEIAPMQGFFVHATADNASVTLNNSHRIHSSDPFLKAGKEEETENFLKLSIAGNGYEDKTVVYLKDNATEVFDPNYDAYRIYSSYPNVPHIFTLIENNQIPLSVNAMNLEINEDIEIPVGVKVQTAGTYTISLDVYNTFENINLYFEDKEEEIFLPIESIGDYQFYFDGGILTERFVLHMKRNNAPIVQNVIPVREVYEDETSDFSINKNTFKEIDFGDEIIRYEAKMASGEELPDWLNFDQDKLNFNAIPGNDEVGEYLIKVSAFDTHNAEGSTEFLLIVINTNDAPYVANQIEDQSTETGQLYTFMIPENVFEDIDVNDKLTVYTENLPDWLTYLPESGTLSGTPDMPGKYKIEIFVHDIAGAFISDIFDLEVFGATNIGNINTEEINIYPNPNNGIFTLDINEIIFKGYMYLNITNITGRKIVTYKIIEKQTEINISEFPKGVYFLNLFSSDNLINFSKMSFKIILN